MNFDKVTKCIVHANCPDGILSAILLRDALPKAEIQFVQYGTPAYAALKPEPGVLYADFSPPVRTKLSTTSLSRTPVYEVDSQDAALLREYVDVGTIVLDHHATAKPVVKAFGANGCFGDEKEQPGICGASLVYENVWELGRRKKYHKDSKVFSEAFAASEDCWPPDDRTPYDAVSDLVSLAGIRDTWRRESRSWRKACAQAAVLMFFPWSHWEERKLDDIVHGLAYQNGFGETLLQKRELEVKEAVEKAYRFTSAKGTRVVVFEGPALSSDVAEFIHDHADLVVAFGYDVEKGPEGRGELAASHPSVLDGSRKVGDVDPLFVYVPRIRLSTRSHTSFDCAAFAKAHGGGGHTKAAGFNLDVHPSDKNPYEYVRELVTVWEALQ